MKDFLIKDRDKKLNIDIFMYIILNIFAITLFVDYIQYITSLNGILTYGISIFITTIINLLIRKKIKINSNVSKIDMLFFIILITLMATTIMFPDRSFDTVNYHTYLQENSFNDKINSDFFPGKNLNTFSFFIADRVNYIFRYLLGYRMGVIIKYFIMIVLYYQLKKIFNKLMPNINSCVNSLFCILTIFSTTMLDTIDDYYIDNYATMFLLELIYITFFYENINSKHKLIYASILTGISIAIKPTNVMLVLPILIFFILKNRKEIFKIKNVILISILTTIPVFPYIIYNYITTKNPIFPYFNKLFKSEYFSNTNWKDIKFGPNGIFEILIWPIKMFMYPFKANDSGIFEIMWGLGYVIVCTTIVVYLINKLFRKSKNVSSINLYLLTFALYLIWGYQLLGYTRYGIIVVVLASVCTFFSLYKLFYTKKYIITGLITVVLFINTSIFISDMFLTNKSWVFNNILNGNETTYFKEIKLLFNDRNIDKLELNGIWGILQYNSGYATLLNSDIPIISLNAGVNNEKTKQILENHLSKANKIYTITDTYIFGDIFKLLNDGDWVIKGIPYVLTPDFVNLKTYLYIFEIEKNTDLNKKVINDTYTLNLSNEHKYSFDLSQKLSSNKIRISFFAMKNHVCRTSNSDDFDIELCVKYNNGEINVIDTKTISKNGESVFVDKYINTNNIANIYIQVKEDKNGTKNDVTLINPNIEIL